MHIDAVTVSMPEQEKTNNQIIDLIRQYSQETFEGDIESLLRVVLKLLEISGAKNRRWLSEDEKPIDHIIKASLEALEKSGVNKDDIDLLIYVGVVKGILEPAQSYMVANALGIHNVECFDILDACMSWSRAMHISEALLNSGRYNKILIVNGEFGSINGGFMFPENFKLKNQQQLEWTFPSFTMGNAATATLVSPDSKNPWTWFFLSRPDLSDLCSIQIFNLEFYAKKNNFIGKNGEFNFTSFGKDLHENALNPCVELINKIFQLYDDIKYVFPHSSSFREWDKFAKVANIQHKILHVYPMYGNVISASVPMNLALSYQNGLIERGDRLAGWMASAGMSFSTYSFIF